jgi:hypothetical protein
MEMEALSPAYVYFLRHDSEPRIKIGKAIDMPRRWKQLGEPFNLSQSFYTVCSSEAEAFVLEKKLHRAFKNQRLDLDKRFQGSTEWFDAVVIDTILELVDGVLPVEAVAPRPRLKKVKQKMPMWQIRPGLYSHWQYEFRLLLIEALRECTLEFKGDKLYIEGNQAEKYGYLLFRYWVDYQVGYESGWFKIFGSMSIPNPPSLRYSLTINSSIPLSTFAGLVAVPGEQFQTSFSYV